MTNTTISTAGANSGAIATDRGGGTISVSGGSVTTSGQDSPAIYSTGAITVTGSSLSNTAATGPLFYVTNSTGAITLKGVKVTAASGVLIKAATGNWSNSGSNGGTAVFTADGEILTGDLVSDGSSSIAATLQNGTTLTGTINSASLTLDATGVWNVTGDSHLTSLSDASGISGTTITNINGNGHMVYYDAGLSANSALGGKTHSLTGGGQLAPRS